MPYNSQVTATENAKNLCYSRVKLTSLKKYKTLTHAPPKIQGIKLLSIFGFVLEMRYN